MQDEKQPMSRLELYLDTIVEGRLIHVSRKDEIMFLVNEIIAAERQSMLNSVECDEDLFGEVFNEHGESLGDYISKEDFQRTLASQQERNKAIPKCLEDLPTAYDGEYIIKSDVIKLLQSVEMPSDSEILDNEEYPMYMERSNDELEGFEMGAKWMRSKASLALLAQQEKNRKEMQQFAKWLQINKFKIFGQDIIAAMTNINFSDLLTQFYNETKNKPS